MQERGDDHSSGGNVPMHHQTQPHPMLERSFFYLPQFTQPVAAAPVPIQLQEQVSTLPRNMPSAKVTANRKCDVCGKCFSTPGNCSIHKKKHIAEVDKVK